MSKTAILEIDGKRYEFPVVEGKTNKAIDIKKLRDLTGIITLDPGYKNSGSCTSKITFLDGVRILRYRDIPSKIWLTKRIF
jgi:citrate synthase